MRPMNGGTSEDGKPKFLVVRLPAACDLPFACDMVAVS
jgi:hypothetical protein